MTDLNKTKQKLNNFKISVQNHFKKNDRTKCCINNLFLLNFCYDINHKKFNSANQYSNIHVICDSKQKPLKLK